MALPSLVKTWQFNVNNRAGIAESTTWEFRRTLWGIKDALVNFPLKPMLVARSSNGSTAGAGDNWTTASNVYPGTGAHAWIVLRSQGDIPWEICIDWYDTVYYEMGYIGFSPSGSFNAAGGGTDGTTSARPTAPDEVTIHGANHRWCGGKTAQFYSVIHAMMSTDGNTTMLIVHIDQSPVIVLRVDLLQNPTPGYSLSGGPGMHFWCRFGTDTTNILDFADSAGSSYKWSIDDVDGVNSNVYFSYEAISNNTSFAGASFTSPDAWTGKWPFYPIGVWTAGSMRGRVGTITDMWFGSLATHEGDMYPDVAPLYQFAAVGDLIIPWDGLSPLIKA